MSRFARVAVNVPSLAGVFVQKGGASSSPANMTFDYALPQALEHALVPGHLVIVPFSNRAVQGVVLALLDEPAVAETRPVQALVDPDPVLTSAQIALAAWLADRTFAPIGSIIGLFLPPGVSQQSDTLYSARLSEPSSPGAEPNKVAARILRMLQDRGPLRGRQIDRALPRVDWRRTAQSLVRRGLLDAASVLPPAAVRPKFVRTAQLAVSPQAAQAVLDSLGSTAVTRDRRRKALEYLIRRPEPVNVSWVYAESGSNLGDLQELAERELIVLQEQEVWRDPIGIGFDAGDLSRSGPAYVELTTEQRAVLRSVEEALKQTSAGRDVSPILLQGITGSGKTELYIRVATEVARAGRRVLVLVPEIALTPQIVQRFLVHFPGQVGMIHSRLSDGERYDTWRRARQGALRVIIGPRSALFSPLPDIGLIVVDECHDASYHQAEPPFYDAVALAQALARLSTAVCILGSATPSVVQRHAADIGELTLLELKRRVAADAAATPSPVVALPSVQIVDMREELKTGNRDSFSRALTLSLQTVLDHGEQAILYLNRRGTATHVFCRNCGFVLRCPRCESPLTFHLASGTRLVCHRCGYQRGLPRACPECGRTEIRQYGLGTEKVETELQAAFPKARILRWDWDTTRQKDSHSLLLHHFASGQADFLIGTQMLAKGLDLPKVTLVGIVMADVGLFLPDPFAAERVFQLLTQVAGRAGRSLLGGHVVLQTFSPDHYAIRAAARHDAAGFHAAELDQRRRLGFPPFTRLLRLEYRHHDPVKAEDAARQLSEILKERLQAQSPDAPAVIGPAPCFFSKLDGKFRWQIVLRGAAPGSYLQGLRLADWRIEADPVSLL